MRRVDFKNMTIVGSFTMYLYDVSLSVSLGLYGNERFRRPKGIGIETEFCLEGYHTN